MRIVLTAVVGLATLLVACSSGGTGASGSPVAGQSPLSDGTPPASGPSSAADPALASIVDPVLADAAARLGEDRVTLRVVSVDAVTWNDGSLGCPKPGELYTQALVEGHRIVVAGAAASLDYRVTGPGAFRVCENPPTTEPSLKP